MHFFQNTNSTFYFQVVNIFIFRLKMYCNFNYSIKGAMIQHKKLLEKENSIVFSEQIDVSGARKFSVMMQDKFAIQYAALERRSFYEVLTANKFKKLYFDIDIPRIDSDIEESGELVIDFLKFSSAILQKIIGLDISIDDWFLLNSSTIKKASYHAILNHSNLRFLKLNEMRKFVLYLINQYENEVRPLDIKKGSGNKIVDLNVYKENQNMRLFLSTKMGKENVLNIDPRDVHILKLSDETEDDITIQVILASLITQYTKSKLVAEEQECFKPILSISPDEKSKPAQKLEIKNSHYDKDTELIGFVKDNFKANIKYVNVKSDSLYILLDPPLVCPYQSRVHSKNNTYLVINLETRSWTEFCHGSDCKNKKGVWTMLSPYFKLTLNKQA